MIESRRYHCPLKGVCLVDVIQAGMALEGQARQRIDETGHEEASKQKSLRR